MATLLEIKPVKTYATKENAIKAVEKYIPVEHLREIRYIIMPTEDGRFFPVFIGVECLQHGIHFKFNIIG